MTSLALFQTDNEREHQIAPHLEANNNQAVTPARCMRRSVISKDGTRIGYLQLGRGPGLVLVCGTMVSAQSFIELAEALSDSFTVYLPDRRGRGMSGPYGCDYGMQREVEDLEAIMQMGAQRVFGISAGGLIGLQAAMQLPTIHKVALYEPALSVNGSIPTAWLARYDKEIAQGKIASALVTCMKGTGIGPPILNRMPRWILEPLTKMAMASEGKKAKADDVSMRMLAGTPRHDFQLVVEMEGAIERFKSLRAQVLLLGGNKSPDYFRVALDSLAEVLPDARRAQLPGLDHGGACNANRGGQPEQVAQPLRRFFA
jgi:pimeloyl-ACP methyl ester carboxylesterase